MNFHFQNKRLEFSATEEFIFRFLSYATYIGLLGVSILAIISSSPHLNWLGLFILMLLTSRLIHNQKGDKTIEKIKEQAKKSSGNIAAPLTLEAIKTLNKTLRKAKKGGNIYLSLLNNLTRQSDIKESLKRLGVEPNKFKNKIKEFQDESEKNQNNNSETKRKLIEVTKKSFLSAMDRKEDFINNRSLFAGTLKVEDSQISKLLDFFEIEPKEVEEALIFGKFHLINQYWLPKSTDGFTKTKSKEQNIMNRAWTARPTPFLDKFSKDLTSLAKKSKVGLLVGHNEEFERILDVLSRPQKPNALIYGRPGVGKSTIINHLAQKIVNDEVPESLFDKRLISLDVGHLIANANNKEITGRLKKISKEIRKAGNIILFIPDIHKLFKVAKNKGGVNLMEILLPIIQKNNTPFIGETTPSSFKRQIDGEAKFLDQFEKIKIEEMNEKEATRVLTYKSIILEKKYKPKVTLKSINKAISLSHKYLSKKPLPTSALDLLKQALIKADRKERKLLKEKNVTKVAEQISNIPIRKAEEKEAKKLLNLEERMHEKFINQKRAVESVSNSLRKYRSGLADEGGPIATFLFVGPTGVGKTELSKQLSKIQFGSTEAMIRFDMSEYQNKESIHQLIGSPDGEKTGALTDAVLNQPYSLILLDEFEKAHSEILNIFLQVFDDGRLTDNLNRTVKFENTIIIATSNAHSKFIKEEIEKGKDVSKISSEIKQKLTDYFKPELLNRFSEIITFKTLDQEEIKKIAKIKLNKLKKKK
ncbi:MAG: AAA family ATPase [Candidatus Magasanikbacteria bacterium]